MTALPPSVLLLDLTLPTPEANLGLEEALLDHAPALGSPLLRLWEPPFHFVVLGRSSQLDEVQVEQCRSEGVPILRRASGGGVVLAGPGSLMYSLVLPQEALGKSRGIDAAHDYVLGRVVRALQPLAPTVHRAGTSDLAIVVDGADLKVSGNALRMRSNRMLYHGTLLYGFNLPNVSRWLGQPMRTPDYRGDRSHGGFITNLPLSGAELRQALISEWSADKPLTDPPIARAAVLAKTKYAEENWTRSGRWHEPAATPLDPKGTSP